MQSLDTFAVSDLRGRLKGIQSTTFSARIFKLAIENYLKEFSALQQSIAASVEHYETIFPRSTAELRLIFGVD